MELYSHTDEKAILGAMMVDQLTAEKVLAQLSVDEFHDQNHKKIFTAMEMLAIGKSKIDLVSVTDYLEKHDGMKPGGFQYLSDMTMVFVPSGNIESHIAAIKGYAMRRAWLKKAEEIKELACNVDKQVEEVYCDILSAVESAKPQNDTREDESIKSILVEVYESIGKKSAGESLGVGTGIASFDVVTGGLYGGELTVIGARPGAGKSTLAMQISIGVARRGKTVQFFSLEMSREQYGVRVFSYDSGVSSMVMRMGQVGGEEFKLLHDALQEYADLPLYINTKVRTPMQMRNICLERGNVDLVVVDYLQLVRPNGKYGNREQEVAAASRAFKELALELNMPVVVLSQLRRNGDSEPTMNDLRESGAIEQDADNIVLMHEPDKWKDADDQQMMVDCLSRGERLVKVMIEKQRQGNRSYFNLVFRPAKMEFISLLKE